MSPSRVSVLFIERTPDPAALTTTGRPRLPLSTAKTLSTASLSVYVILLALAPQLRPCYVARRPPWTLVYVHGDAPLHEGILWATENLTLLEREYIRAAVGLLPIGQLIDPTLMEAPMGVAFDVPSLWLPVQRPPTVLPLMTPAVRGRTDWSPHED